MKGINFDGDFLTKIARTWFWDENKPYEKSEALLKTCVGAKNDDEERHICQDIIEGRKKLVGSSDAPELVDDNTRVRPIYQKIGTLQQELMIEKIKDDMHIHPLNYIDRFAMTESYTRLAKAVERGYWDGSFDSVLNIVLDGRDPGKDSLGYGTWLFQRPDLVAEINGGPLTEQIDARSYYSTGFWLKLGEWVSDNIKDDSAAKRTRKYLNYLTGKDNMQMGQYGLIAPNGKWYDCEFGGHLSLASNIVMTHKEQFGLSDKEALDMFCSWNGQALDYLYDHGWIAIRNPSMGKTFIDMSPTATATKDQINTIFDYISKFKRYDMDVSKIMAD